MPRENISSFPSDMIKEDPIIEFWLKILIEKEDGRSFSEVFMNNKAFCDWAEASVHTKGTMQWFEKLILGQMEEELNRICQTVNQRLLHFRIESAKKMKENSRGGTSVHLKIMEIN